MKYSSPELVEQLAAEYVLGTLHGGARRRFERLISDRADVRWAVRRWEELLAPLAASSALAIPMPSSLRERVWRKLSHQLSSLPTSRSTPAQMPSSAPSKWSWLRRASWGLGGLASGVALSAVALFTAPTLFFTTDQIAMRSGERLPQSYVGVLTDAQGHGRLLVSSLRHGKTVTLKVLGQGELGISTAPLQLWALPPAEVNGGKPFLLANVPVQGSATALLPDTSEKLLSKVSKLAVTQINPADPSSPGAVVLTGNCAKLW